MKRFVICLDGTWKEAREMEHIDSVTQITRRGGFHFVHFLAHGAIAGDNEWGLALSNGAVTGRQLASALTAGGSTPAMVSVAACDSANNRDNSFGSVAFELHASGIPFVHASQLRLRKTVSVETVGELYRGVLGGEDPLRSSMTSNASELPLLRDQRDSPQPSGG